MRDLPFPRLQPFCRESNGGLLFLLPREDWFNSGTLENFPAEVDPAAAQ